MELITEEKQQFLGMPSKSFIYISSSAPFLSDPLHVFAIPIYFLSSRTVQQRSTCRFSPRRDKMSKHRMNESRRSSGSQQGHNRRNDELRSESTSITSSTHHTQGTSAILDNFEDESLLFGGFQNNPQAARAMDRIMDRHRRQNGHNGDDENLDLDDGGPSSLSAPSRRASSSHSHNTAIRSTKTSSDYAQPPLAPSLANLDLFNPPQLRDIAWSEQEARNDMDKTIDNVAYYQGLTARYAAVRRKVGPAKWAASTDWHEQEAWAINMTRHWATHRLQIMENGN